MNPASISLSPHRQSILLTAVCAVIVGLIFLLTVAGDIRTERRLSRQLTEVSALKEQRETLAPVMAQLQKNRDTSSSGEDALADSAMVSEARAEDYEATLRKLLGHCALEEVAIMPDAGSALSDEGSIRVDLTARGAFSDFRCLIMQLGGLRYLAGINRFRIRKETDGRQLELFLQLTIQLEQPEIVHEENQ